MEALKGGVGFAIEEGFWLGKATAGSYRLYGKNFYGNQFLVRDDLRLLNLQKTIRIGGALITTIGLSADALNVLNTLPGVAREAAVQRLVSNILLTGLYFVSAEAGILVQIGGVIHDDPKTQKLIRQNLEKIAGDPSNPRNFAAWKKLQEIDKNHDPCPCFFRQN